MTYSRDAIVKQMQAWLGCKESNGTHKKIIDIYNSHTPRARGYKLKYTDAWCAGTASAVAIACGYTDIIPTEVGCDKMIALFKKMGCWVENDAYVPKKADFVFYDWDDSGKGDNKGSSDHVGIVEKVSGGVITVIEGNKNDSVARRTLKVNGKYIRGYGVPKYDDAVNPEDIKIYLDYGHGGSDNGAVKYLTEDKMNLVQGRACAAELRANGFQVKECRTTDTNKSLADRVKEANEWGADLFLSFHNNAGGGDGFEAYAMSDEGRAIAKAIETQVKAMGQNSRGIKDGSHLYVVKNTNAPAALLEGFFVDNKKDAAQNDTTAEQQKYGQAVAKGVMDHYGITPKKTADGSNKATTTATKKAYSGTFPTLPKKGYLKNGDTGTQVGYLQSFLNWAIDAGLKVDKDFGDLTEKAVRTYQKKYGLTIDGEFGTKSLAKAKTIKK